MGAFCLKISEISARYLSQTDCCSHFLISPIATDESDVILLQQSIRMYWFSEPIDVQNIKGMFVSSTKQSYDALLVERAWDKDTQISFFLEYIEEYKLADHFLSYLGLKPIATPSVIISSKEYSIEQFIEIIVKNERISEIIKENSLVTKDENPWTTANIAKCVKESLSVALEPEDEQLEKELLAYFNLRHASFIKPLQEQTPSESQPSDGDEFFDNIFSRYAKFG